MNTTLCLVPFISGRIGWARSMWEETDPRHRVATRRRGLAVVLIVIGAVAWCGIPADAAVSIVGMNRSAVSGSGTTGFNVTVDSGKTANGVVVIVHCADSVNLATENVAVTVNGVAATAITGGSILHNGTDNDVQLETFYCAGTWSGTIAIQWTWIGTTPQDTLVGAYALSGMSGADWPFQAVKYRSDPVNSNQRSVVMPAMNTAINGSIVIWAYTSDSQNDATPSMSPALQGGTTTAWQLSDSSGGGANTCRLRAECWYGTASDANDSEILGTTNGSSRVVLIGLSLLPVPPTVTSITRVDTNPTSAGTVTFNVNFSEAVSGVGVDDFSLTASGVSGAFIDSISTDSGVTRTVTVNTGSGSGTLRLDAVDNDTIMNAERNPLGGPGTHVTGNGSYDGGDVYTIDKTAPTVTSVLRAESDPTNAQSVTFFVDFSEFVTGVGPEDFTVVTSGITDAAVTLVWPAGESAWRLVSVNTGTGSGTLRLDVLADGSIRDPLSTPLTLPYAQGESYTIDKWPPVGTLSIDGGLYPPSEVVTMTLSATDVNGVEAMRFSNDTVLWSLEEAYATSKVWTLSPEDGVKTVYVEYKDALGNWSTTPITDQVIRDTTPPTGTIVAGTNGYSNATNTVLSLSASDVNGVARMRFSNDNADWTPDEAYTTARTWALLPGADGTRTVYVQYQDNAGLWSTETIKADLILDTVPPDPASASIEINGGSPYATSPNVTLALLASDTNGIASMEFSNDNANWGAEQAYATSATWTLSPGDGAKTVYVQYKDSAGNWSTAINDDILLDTTPPAKPVMTVVPPTVSQRPTWSWLPGGGGSGIYEWDLDTSGVWNETSNTSFTPETDLPEGNHRLFVRERDDAGNWSQHSFFDIFVDLTDPVLMVYGLGTTNDVTPIFSGAVYDNLAVAKVEVAIVGGSTFVASFGSGKWNAQVPNDQALVGAPPTSYVADVTATDTAGRTATERIYFRVDSTVPTMVNYVATVGSPVTNASSVVFDVEFSMGVYAVTIDDLALYAEGLSGATIDSVAGVANSDIWHVTVSTGSGEGTIRLDVVDRDTIIDVYNHPLGGQGMGNGDYSAGGIYTVDRTSPTVELTSSAPHMNNLASIPIVLTFSEDIPSLLYDGTPNFVEGDIALSNATLSDFEAIAPSVYHANVVPLSDGPVTIDVAAGAAKDQAGNDNAAAATLAFDSDRTAPEALLTGPGPATNILPIVFTINFTEPVTGLTPDDISVLGGVKGTLSGSGAGPYTLPVTPPGDGAVTCEVLMGAVQDAALNLNPASEVLTVRLDRMAPRPTVTGPASPTNAYPIDFTITFDESVTGLDSAEITVTNGTKDAFSGSGAGPYHLLVYPVTEGAVSCQVPVGAALDAAGNPNIASNNLSIVSDRGALGVAISGPSVPITRSGPVSYTVTYTGATVITLQSSDVTLNATGTAAGTVHVSGTGFQERTVTIDGITGTGRLGITIGAGTASDNAGHTAEAMGPSATFMVDNTGPVVTVNPLGIVNDLTPTISGTATDNVGIARVDVTIDGGTAYEAPVNDIWWNVRISDALAPGEHVASVTATDTVGNTGTETMSFTVDTGAPTTVEAVTLSNASPTNRASVAFEVIFSGAVAPVVVDDLLLTVTGGINGASITGIAGSGRQRTVTVNTGSGDGTIRLDVVDRDTILDTGLNPLGGTGLGNGNYSLGQSYTVDRSIPHAVITITSANPTGADTLMFSVVFSETILPAFDATKASLTGSLAGTVSVEGSDLVYGVSVALADPNLDGTLGLSIGKGLADAAGNTCALSVSPLCNVYNWLIPRFIKHPQNARAYVGNSQTFTVQANCGTDLLGYQWKWDNHTAKTIQPVGDNTADYTIPVVTAALEGDYWCEVTYDGFTSESASASLEVAEPLLVTGPYNVTAPLDGSCTFNVAATGGYPPLSYAWKKAGNLAILSTADSLILNALKYEDGGIYTVEVSDSNVMAVTNAATLTVGGAGLPAAGILGLGFLASGMVLGGAWRMRRRE